MTPTIELIEFGNGYAYRVDHIYQEYDPDFEGYVVMDYERAHECALAVAERLAPHVDEN